MSNYSGNELGVRNVTVATSWSCVLNVPKKDTIRFIFILLQVGPRLSALQISSWWNTWRNQGALCLPSLALSTFFRRKDDMTLSFDTSQFLVQGII